MSNNTNNKDIPMDDLFRENSQDYIIPTDEKDFEEFMNQLEETGYFNKPKRRFLYLIILAFGLLAGSLSIFFFINNNKTDEENNLPAVERNSYNEPEVTSNPIAVDTLKKETLHKLNEQSIEAPNKIRDKKDKKETVSSNSRLKSTDNKANNEKIILPTKDTVAVTPNQPKIKIDSLKNQTSNITIKKEPKVTYRIVEKVDTVSITDTTRISKRKHDRLKNKKQ